MQRPGIIAALAVEANLLVNCRPWVVRAGIGPVCARAAARGLIERGAPALLSFGLAAGLAPGLAAGALLLPDYVLFEDGSRRETDPGWRARLAASMGDAVAFHSGALAGVGRPLTAAAEKQHLHEATDAFAADMESAAIFQAATDAGIPFLALRAVADPAERAVPAAALAAIGPNGATRRVAALRALARRPEEMISMLRIARDGRRGIRSLRRVALLCGPGFGLA